MNIPLVPLYSRTSDNDGRISAENFDEIMSGLTDHDRFMVVRHIRRLIAPLMNN